CIILYSLACSFFFSSRRRHTRSKPDWSSDVCSSDLLKFFYQHGKTPKINPGLRFIKNAELMLFHKNRGNFDPLHLASGKSRIHFPVQIFLRAEAYPAQKPAADMLRKIRSRSQAQQSSDSHSFKPGRLLKRKTNSSFRTLINRKTRNVLPVQPDLPFGRFIKPHHEFG